MNSGSFESFHVSWRCGCSPNAFQIRSTADCVEADLGAPSTASTNASRPSGVVSSVLTITSSTCASVTVRGRPGRGSSVKPVEAMLGKPRAPLAAMLR